jgi:hypothetical protein
MEGFIERLERERISGRKERVSVERLRRVDILQGLSEGELQGIAQFFEEEDVVPGVTLCEEGARPEMRSRRTRPLGEGEVCPGFLDRGGR